jgi:hypothetical protein
VLDAFRETAKTLSLTQIASKTGLSAATVFRILYTLERHGLVTRVAERQYLLNIKLPKRRRYRIGYAGQSQEFSFARLVAEGITRAAEAAEIDLIVVDNRYSPKVAVRNADLLVGERVELAIEFQTDEHVAPVISAKFLEAHIPIVALEIPHPGATYYGANNYAAGLMAGRYLGRCVSRMAVYRSFGLGDVFVNLQMQQDLAGSSAASSSIFSSKLPEMFRNYARFAPIAIRKTAVNDQLDVSPLPPCRCLGGESLKVYGVGYEFQCSR